MPWDEQIECECHEVHGDAVSCAKSFIIDQGDTGLSDFFKLFADGTRLRILLSLDRTELCVCDLCEVLDMNKSAVSHQLRVLKDAHLVASRKEGRNVFYSLCDDHVRTIIETALEHVSEKNRAQNTWLNSDLGSPQTGHIQSSGRSANLTPSLSSS